MPSQNPFSEQFADQGPSHPPTPHLPPAPSGGKVLKVLALVALAVCFICGGFATLGYLGVKRLVSPQTDVDLPTVRNTFAEDSRKFNESLAQLTAGAPLDPEVTRLVNRAVSALNAGEDLPFSRDMFMEAVAASPLSGGSLNVLERLSLQNSLRAYEPVPTSNVTYHRILQVRVEPSGRLGVVDLVCYSEHLQAESQQWFIVKEDGRWRFYDWQCLEYGRRSSDEYAAFAKGSTLLSMGFDNMMTKLNDASAKWNAGDEKAARRILKSCENTPMLAEDREEALLHLAHMWTSFNDFDEALRVAKRIRSPDQMWGVWPVLGVCHVFNGDYEHALVAAERARKLSPDHPNVHSLLFAIYSNLGRDSEAAAAALRALSVCPQDTTLLRDVIDYGRPENIPPLLDILVENRLEDAWASLLNQADSATEWAAALVEQAENRDDVPAGFAELARGSLAWSQEDYDAAAEFYWQGRQKAKADYLKARALDDYLWARLEADRFDELFRDVGDSEEVMATLVEWAYDDSFYGDETKLLEALENHAAARESPWGTGLRGWASYNLGEYEAALAGYEGFLSWLTSNSASLRDDQQWMIETTEYYVADSLLNLDRAYDVVQRWPDDVSRHEQVGTHLLAVHKEDAISEFLRQTSESSQDSMRLQRCRLEAGLAMRRGDARGCDSWHQKAIGLGSKVYGEEYSYLFDSLVRDRAKALARHRVDPSELQTGTNVDLGRDRYHEFLLAAVSEAALLRDVALAERWFGYARSEGIDEGARAARLQQDMGNLRSATGDSAGAIGALGNCLRATDAEDIWYYDQRRDGLLAEMLAAERWADARKLARTNPSVTYDVPLEAIIDLASGDGAALRDRLSGLDASTVADWLSVSTVVRFRDQHADQPWLIALLEQAPIDVDYRHPVEQGELLLEPQATIDEQAIRDGLEQALSESFHVEIVPGLEANGDTQTWLATSATGQRLLLSRSVCSYETRRLPESLAAALSQPSTRLTIEIFDDRPHATRRLFKIAEQFADPAGLAFSWGAESLVWPAPDLAQQLAWQDRVPVSPQVLPFFLQRKLDDQADVEYVELRDWERRLKDSDGPIPVYLHLSTRFSTEVLPAELLSVAVDEYEIVVRAGADSKIHPIVRSGIRYNAGSTTLSLRSQPESPAP